MSRRKGIGRSEMEVLRYIADHHPITVREVADHFAETKGQARTTPLTVMERLRLKGFLTREQVDGVYRYSPSQPRAEFHASLIRDFVATALGGSLSPFMAYLSCEAELTETELESLRGILREHEPPAPGEKS